MRNGWEEPAHHEEQLLAIVAAVAAELHPGRHGAPTTLDSRLDRDLGFDSLGRMELLARLERYFAVALPDQLAADAETPRDLLRALPDAAAAATPSLERVTLGAVPGLDLPVTAMTWPAVLDWHVERHPDAAHIHFYRDHGPVEVLTYGVLAGEARRLAAGLQARGVTGGQAVAIMLPTGRDYFIAFLGTLLAGAVPVPLYPPFRRTHLEDHLRRQAGILTNCRAELLMTTADLVRLRAVLGGLREVLTPQDLAAAAGSPALPVADAGDTALLQYTSGSTGAPKGVILSRANLLANVRAMGRAIEARPGDVVVSWLPLYHDMGLIGAWLGSLYHGLPLVLMSPLDFIARPARWLWAIHRYQGTITAAPNFAYELCLRRLSDDDIAGLDLSSLRALLNGAEAISPATVDRFLERFVVVGLRREAMMPVYGLAECSVGLSFPPLGRGQVIDAIDGNRLAVAGEAVLTSDAARTKRVVGCGRPLPGHELRVVDGQDRELPERREGHIQFRGPSATSGYVRNAAATTRLFRGDWLDSGDLGYMAAGEIFVTGRSKDMIIKAGRNIYPEALEEAVGAIEGVRKGNVAAFASVDRRDGGERLIVVAETRVTDAAHRQALEGAVAEAVTTVIDMPPDAVVLAPPNTVPKTSSGKIRRTACRQLYESGAIGQSRRPLWRQHVALRLVVLGGLVRRQRRRLGEILFAVYAWAAVAAISVPGWLAVVLLPRLDWRWWVARRLLRVLAAVTGTRVVVGGLDTVPAGPLVYVANHASYLDGFVLASLLPGRPSFVAKAELARTWATAWPLRRLGCRFVERADTARSIADARALAAITDRPLVVFPEGGITRVPGLRPFRMGAFSLAAAKELPLVPVAIRGTRSMLRAGSWLPRRGMIRVEIGPASAPQARADSWTEAVRLRDVVRHWLLDHCGEPDLAMDQ